MSEKNKKKYKTEWSFSFDKLGDDIKGFANSLGDSSESQLKHDTFENAIGNATSAKIRLDISAGDSDVYALENSDNLIHADIAYIGDIKFVAEDDDENPTERIIHLSHDTAGAGEWIRNVFGMIGNSNKLKWNIGLSPDLPIELDIHAGVGKAEFDLSHLNITQLNISGGAGEFEAKLPRGSYPAKISCGVGEVSIEIPSGADVDLNVGGGTGEINLDIEADANVQAVIRAGVGEVNVEVAQETPVKLTAKHGLGSINVSKRVPRVSGSDKGFDRSGSWQSHGFEGAENTVSIRYDGGVGAFNLK